MSTSSERSLSLLERYAFARSQLGFPQCISFVVAYPTLPSESSLHDRLAALQASWPHLSSRIADGIIPTWVQGEPWPGDRLVNTNQQSLPLGDMLLLEQTRFKEQFSSTSPLFRVTLYTGDTSYIGVSVAHELADGLGSLRLVEAILGATPTPEAPPPPLEDTINLRVPLTTMMGVVFHKLLLPKLPSFVSSYFPRDDVWPGVVSAPPMACEDAVQHIPLAPALLTHLTAARGRHAPTVSIHALVKIAWTFALASVIPPTIITAGTPRSERVNTPSLGNYVSSLSFRFTPAILQQPFWPLATTVSAHLKSAAAIQQGREAVGMLAYVPSSAPDSWQQFFKDQSNSLMPYSDSWELSNLGIAKLPLGATDMAWMQPGAIIGTAINVSMLRHEGGLRLAVSWREGAVNGDVVRQVAKEFQKILQELIDT